MSAPAPVVQYLKNYQAPQFEIESVYLQVELQPSDTRVSNTMRIKALSANAALVLNGEQLSLEQVLVNQQDITQACQKDAETLTLPNLSDFGVEPFASFTLEIITRIAPEKNTALEGLYRTSGNYCTQCEAEGFRKITYYLDRPDVLSCFTTKIVADKTENRVLLSNGNLIESGDLPDNRHYAVWHDPFKKPCYLFALVAGNLACVEDVFCTADGRNVALKIYVEPRNLDQCEHAMASLKKSMQWDETRFGLIYDLDIYMIVAVDDFNMGAMENKGLNVFNSKFVLAKPDSATDVDYEGIEAVIAHEYFHNWTGNRVTCRDWFQLTLKEGLTVFRDQEFTADMLSPAVKRIEDVKRLRSNQFPEDAGPMAHPIQPQSYIEMNNFYTMTVYEKGAEVVRMYHTLLGETGFRRGMDLYFNRHDGQAVTVDDFRLAMQDANGVDLAQMHHWYVQAGTPIVNITTHYDAVTNTYQITVTQALEAVANVNEFKPLLIPIKMSLLNSAGLVMPLTPDHASALKVIGSSDECILKVTQATELFEFIGVSERPMPAFLKGFSAPVRLEYAYTEAELSLLSRADGDAFVRWEAMQTLAMNELKVNIKRFEEHQSLQVSSAMNRAFKGVLESAMSDLGFTALALTLPDLTYVGEQYTTIPVEAVYEVHRWLRAELAGAFSADLLAIYHALNQDEAYRYHKVDIAKRKLKTVCLRYLMLLPEHQSLARAHYFTSGNMTDALAALETLSHTDSSDRTECLAHFYQKWHQDTLVLDKWFTLQAASHHRHALEHVNTLIEHPDFIYTNPNRVRSVLGVFGRLNWLGFHRADGLGYAFLAEQVVKLDALNPQVAARMVAPFTHWRRFDAGRKAHMQSALQRIVSHGGLSKDVYEIVSKSLE